VLEALSKAILASLARPVVTEQILKLGFTMRLRDPAAFRPYHRQEISTWENIIKAAGVKPE
jgi:tripartite-type tricarboxylate transporter receptor subunit TctC